MPEIVGRDKLGRPIRNLTIAERLAKYTRVEGECVVWTACRSPKGYGRASFGGRPHLVSRLVYAAARGPIPDGLSVCHRCDNPPCVRLDHLFIGTTADNSADRVAKGRSARLCGEKSGMAKLTAEQVRQIKQRAVAGELYHDIAHDFGISAGHVSQVARGNRRACDGGPSCPSRDNRDRTHCPHGHPLDGLRPNGHRYCKTCRRLYAREKKLRIRHQSQSTA